MAKPLQEFQRVFTSEEITEADDSFDPASFDDHDIPTRTSEKERSNQSPSEGVIRELRKKLYRTMFKSGCPQRLWNYGLPHTSKVIQHTASYSDNLNGITPIDKLIGETPDISEYLDFDFMIG